MHLKIIVVNLLFSLCFCDYQHPDIWKDAINTNEDKTRTKRDIESVVEDQTYWMEQGAKELQEALKVLF